MKTPDYVYLRGGLVLLAASGMMFKDEMRLRSGNDTDGMNYQPERTAVRYRFRHLLTVAREPAPKRVSHESLLVKKSSIDPLMYL
jgi:hypothetical protein